MTLRNCLLYGVLIASTSFPARAQWLDTPESEAAVRRGINHVYNLSFDSARAEFGSVVKSHPTHPAGHFFLAMVEWWNIVLNLDDESRDEKFFDMLETVIDLCEERLDENDRDLVALFFKGGAVGFRGRLHANREDWVKAANDGRIGLSTIQKAHEIDPKNYDVMLGIGIYNYYAEVVPEKYPFVKPFMIFFPDGDKAKGIEQLRIAAEKGTYANVEASYFLTQILYFFEKQYDEALELATELHRRFPDNAIFHRYIGRCNAALGRYGVMQKVFNEIRARAARGKLGYGPIVEREARYYLGLAEMQLGNHDSALVHFFRCDELSRAVDKKEQSGFMVLANLKAGMIFDLQKKRDVAIQQYKKVLKWGEYQGSHKTAEEYLRTPYGKN